MGSRAKWLAPVARELSAARGRCLIVLGISDSEGSTPWCRYINDVAGAPWARRSTSNPVADPDELDAATDLKALTDMQAGQVDTPVILGGNPCTTRRA